MKYPLLTIASDGAAPTKRNRYRKTRSFQCTLLRCVVWPAYKPSQGKGTTILRPIFLDYCGTESEHRAFTANLRCGKIATLSDREGIELLRSEPYKYAPPMRCDAGVRQIVYYPEVFDLDSKEQRDDVWLCVMPPTGLLGGVTVQELAAARAALRLTNEKLGVARDAVLAANAAVEANNAAYYSMSWQERNERGIVYKQTTTPPSLLQLDDDALRYWALMSRELCVRLDARTRYPIPSDPEFRVLLLQHFLRLGVVKRAEGNCLASLGTENDRYSYRMPLDIRGPMLDYRRLDDVGYVAPLALSMKQDDLGKELAALAGAYYAKDVET